MWICVPVGGSTPETYRVITDALYHVVVRIEPDLNEMMYLSRAQPFESAFVQKRYVVHDTYFKRVHNRG